MVNPPTARGSAEPAGSRVQKAPALGDRRKIPVTLTAICLPVAATWSASVLPGCSRSRAAVAAGTATGRAVPGAAAGCPRRPGAGHERGAAGRIRQRDDVGLCVLAGHGGGDVQVVGAQRAGDVERAAGQRAVQHGGDPRGALGCGGRGTRRRGDQDAGGGAAGQGDPHGIAGHDGRERDKTGKQRGRKDGGEHDRGERKPVRHQAADGGGPTSHASVTSTARFAACPPLPDHGIRQCRITALKYFQVRTGCRCRSTSAAGQ